MSAPTFIRTMHPAGYRTRQWARILTTVEAYGRECWLVEFPDRATDYWVKDDPDGRYEFSDGGYRTSEGEGEPA